MIQGEVPQSLANCTALKSLNLGNNKITDRFPCSLKKIFLREHWMSQYHQWNLGNASNCWPCSQQFWWWTSRRVVNQVEDNDGWRKWRPNIKAQSPPIRAFTIQSIVVLSWCTLTLTYKGREMESVLENVLALFITIDLSSNNFYGSIPQELGQLRALCSLNMSNNALLGSVPSTLGNLHNLELLDLSRNILRGTIPTSLGNLSFLSFLNLSFNQLVGTVPCGYQLRSMTEDSFIGLNLNSQNCSNQNHGDY